MREKRSQQRCLFKTYLGILMRKCVFDDGTASFHLAECWPGAFILACYSWLLSVPEAKGSLYLFSIRGAAVGASVQKPPLGPFGSSVRWDGWVLMDLHADRGTKAQGLSY